MPRSSNKTTQPVSIKSTPVATPTTSMPQLIKEGLGFGIGQAVAINAVNSILGKSQQNSQPLPKSVVDPCLQERVQFESCLQTKNQDEWCGPEQTVYMQCIRNLKLQ